jgi:hemerythrin-like domain-containing protein
MLITDALLGEHGVFHLLLQHIERAVLSLDSISALQNRIAAFAFALEAHASLEDELLFTALEPHLDTQSGPLAVMLMEHAQITDLLGQIESAASLEEGIAFAAQMIQITRAHFQKEEQVLFRMARQFLNEDELSSLGAKWKERRIPFLK